jgi:hypothetical protein
LIFFFFVFFVIIFFVCHRSHKVFLSIQVKLGLAVDATFAAAFITRIWQSLPCPPQSCPLDPSQARVSGGRHFFAASFIKPSSRVFSAVLNTRRPSDLTKRPGEAPSGQALQN